MQEIRTRDATVYGSPRVVVAETKHRILGHCPACQVAVVIMVEEKVGRAGWVLTRNETYWDPDQSETGLVPHTC